VLSRGSELPEGADRLVQANLQNLEELKQQVPLLELVDAVVHLAGESLFALRWTAGKKKKIYDSRVVGTQNLVQVFSDLKKTNLKVFLGASAIGFYGDRADEILDESSARGEGFLADVCADWEKALTQLKIRVVSLRIGVVLSALGGALAQMLPAYRMGLGGKLGSGEQWMSWILLSDLARLTVFCLEQNQVQGVINAVSPQPVRQKDFARALAEVLRRPAWMRMPAVVLQTGLGELSQLLLASQKVSSKKIQDCGFRFEKANLTDALLSEIS